MCGAAKQEETDFYSNNQGLYRHCKKCHNALTKSWKARNKERVYEEGRARRLANPSKNREYVARYNLRHPDRVVAHRKISRVNCKDKISALKKAWNKRNPERNRSYCHKRRTVVKGDDVTKEELLDLRKRQGNKCAACKCALIGRKYHIDHVLPIVLDGPHRIDNLQLLCAPCNLKKGSMPPEEWAARLGLLFV